MMTGPVQFALTLSPLAAYFFMLGVWHRGRSPRLVPGPLDFGLLAFGIWGLLAFGPVGQVMVRLLARTPNVWAWLTWATSLILLALCLAPRSARRLVVYHVEPEAVPQALRACLDELPGSFSPTLRGFEDPRSGRGVAVDLSPAWRTATIEAYGRQPEALIALLLPRLRERLREAAPRCSAAATVWFSLSGLTLVVPLVGLLLSRSEVLAALRALLGRQ